jgi:hypothetical protein
MQLEICFSEGVQMVFVYHHMYAYLEHIAPTTKSVNSTNRRHNR